MRDLKIAEYDPCNLQRPNEQQSEGSVC